MIGTPYTVTFTDPTVPGKGSFVIAPGTTNGPLTPITESPDSTATAINTSIVIAGMGLVQYGQRNANALVHILENFASATPPVAATIGQLWYDYGNAVLKVWNGTQWSYVSAPWQYIASTDEYNAMVSLMNLIIGPPTGTTESTAYGYNQTQLTLLASNVRPVVADWQRLYNAIINIAGHQTTPTTGLVMTDFKMYADPTLQTYGYVTLLNYYQIWLSTLYALQDNRFNVDPTTIETNVPSTGSSTRTTAWGTELQHQIHFTWTNVAAMNSFFNTGGYLTVTGSINSMAGVPNGKWNTLFSNMGTVKIGAFEVTHSGTGLADTGHGEYTGATGYVGANPQVVPGGFYGLTPGTGDGRTTAMFYYGLGTTIPTIDGVTGYKILAIKDTTVGSLTLLIVMNYNNPSAPVGDPTNPATMMSSVTMSKVDTAHLSTPEIPYPTVTPSILLTAGT